jgi:hypothetical protein
MKGIISMRNLISILAIIVIFGTPIFAYAEIKDAQENYLAAKKLFEKKAIEAIPKYLRNYPKGSLTHSFCKYQGR